MFETKDMEKLPDAAESLEKPEPASLEGERGPLAAFIFAAAMELAEPMDSALDDIDSMETLDEVIKALGLDEEEAEVFKDLSAEDMPTKGASGDAKIYGDCISTTCTYTTTYYSCTYTGG